VKQERVVEMESWKPVGLEKGSVINGDGIVCGVDFHRDGRYCVVSTRDTSVHLIDSLAGTEKKKLYTRNQGSGEVKFTHHESCVLMASDQTKGRRDCDIRYLCMYNNQYIRHFRSHKAAVTSISMSPIEDTFLSAGADKAVCVWNFATPGGPVARIQLPPHLSSPTVQFDGSGLVFGVLAQDERTKLHNIKLFDARSYEKPFADIVPSSAIMKAAIARAAPTLNDQGISRLLHAPWTGFDFSPDGLHLLVNTQSDLLYVLDGFSPKDPVVITGRKNESGLNLGACFSADAKHVIVGNDENEILVVDAVSGEVKNTLLGHVSPVGCIKANPKYDILASGCINTVLWIRGTAGSASAAAANDDVPMEM